jgi:hypothetical protein
MADSQLRQAAERPDDERAKYLGNMGRVSAITATDM